MALACKCSRCGLFFSSTKQHPGTHVVMREFIIKNNDGVETGSIINEPLGLCETCSNGLFEYLNECNNKDRRGGD